MDEIIDEYLNILTSIKELQDKEKELKDKILSLLGSKVRIVSHNNTMFKIKKDHKYHYIMKLNASRIVKALVPYDIYQELHKEIDVIDTNKLDKMVSKNIVSGSVISKAFEVIEYDSLLIIPLIKSL